MGYVVYCHTNKINGKRYIGITSRKPEYRWRNGEGYSHNQHFYASIQKYGWHNFTHEILYFGLKKEDAWKIEKRLIAEYDTTNEQKGYNIGTGGEHGADGSKRTPEQNLRKSQQMKTIMNDPAIISKISKARQGIKFSNEHIENLRKSHVGKSPSNKGVPMAEQQKSVLRERKADKMKKVYCRETNRVYESIAETARIIGVRPGNIHSVCEGKRKQTCGYHFRYADVHTDIQVRERD